MADPTPASLDALHAQRDWLLLTLSSIGDAVMTTDADGRVDFLNPTAQALTGWTPPQAAGQPIDGVFRIIDEATRRPVESPAVRAIREGGIRKLARPCLLVAKDGTECPIDDSAAPLRDPAGRVTGDVVIFRDISERRRTERALAKSLAYADDIIATLREPFLILDGDLRVRTANRAFYEAFLVSTGETEGRFVYDLGDGQWNIPGLRALLNEVLTRTRSVHDYQVEHDFPALGRKTMLLNARPFPPDSASPELILLAVEDVSAVRERADELAEAGRQKDEFLATLAHELRNPLAPIRNAVQSLGRDGLAADGVRTARDVIARQVAVMVRLIDDLLDMARISRNQLDVRKERVELAAVVASAVESCRPLVELSGHTLAVGLPPDALTLDADPVRLAQVFINLLNNAAKYTRRGGHIWLTAEREGSDAVVRVRDDGVGIPADMLSRVFDMFTQVDRAREQSRGGLGIGLTLVRRLIDLHDGSIEARSGGPDAGSEFVVRLPLVLPSPLPPPPPSAGGAAAAAALSGRRILVVDDNVDSADSLADLLRLMGNEVRIAYDGQAAAAAAEAFRPGLTLLDIGLPKLNGYDVARRIRQQAWGRGVTLVALTGWGQDEDRRRSREAGFDLHLVKPVDLAALETLLAGVPPAG